jgi:hypothetical protein
VSYALYFCCAGLSFLEKKARGYQTSCTRCWRTAPMAVAEASVTWASGVVRDKLALHSLKAATSATVQVTGCEPLTLGLERTSWRGT